MWLSETLKPYFDINDFFCHRTSIRSSDENSLQSSALLRHLHKYFNTVLYFLRLIPLKTKYNKTYVVERDLSNLL